MPVLKYMSGHAKSVYDAIRYLTKKERSLACDFVNCLETDDRGRPVWRQMDEARHMLGCDVPAMGHKRVCTYIHFVLSPDPKDDVDLKTLRSLATEWAGEYFGSYQVAIYYHDDNASHVPHAHLLVNNANLDRPGRVSTALTPAFGAKIYQGLQRMAAERGLHAFTAKAVSVGSAEWAKADREHEKWEWPRGTTQRTQRSRRDTELEARGISWKKDVRDRMACAMALSSTAEEYVAACRTLGLKVERSKSRKSEGELVYTHPAADEWRVLGATLGRDWSNWGVQRRLARNSKHASEMPSDASREALLKAIASLETERGGHAMQVLGTARGVPVTASAVCDMLEVCGELDIRSAEDFRAAAREPMTLETRGKVRDAMRLADALGHLPQRRDRADGRRSTYEERSRADGRTSHDMAGVRQRPGAQAPNMPDSPSIDVRSRTDSLQR